MPDCFSKVTFNAVGVVSGELLTPTEGWCVSAAGASGRNLPTQPRARPPAVQLRKEATSFVASRSRSTDTNSPTSFMCAIINIADGARRLNLLRQNEEFLAEPVCPACSGRQDTPQ